jgi:hypothetical protein
VKIPTCAFILSILLANVGDRECHAQTTADSASKGISLLVGIGPNYAHGQNFFAEMAMARYEFEHWYIGLRYLYGNETEFGIATDKSINDFGALFGYTFKKRLFYLSGGIGLSYSLFVNRGKFLYTANSNSVGDLAAFYEELHSHAVCIPAQAEAFWMPSEVFGIGVIFFDTINWVENNYGFFVSMKVNLF